MDERKHFFDDPVKTRWFFRAFFLACGVLAVVDFLYPKHVEVSAEGLPVFYCVYGFLGIVVLVLLAKGLRKLVMREEDYHDR